MGREAGDIQEAPLAPKNLQDCRAQLSGGLDPGPAPGGQAPDRAPGSSWVPPRGQGPTQGLGWAIFIPRRAGERAPAPFLPRGPCPSA